MRKALERSVPEHAITVRDYGTFERDVQLLAKGKYNFLMVIGNSGLSKTQTIRNVMGDDCAETSACPTAFGFYKWVYANRHKSILILDDIASKFYRDETCNALLKALTDTTEIKTMHWKTNAAGKEGFPDEFITESRVVILVNDWDSANEHVRAIEGRATTIVFRPSFMEVHKKVSAWFPPKHQDVFDFMFENRAVCMKPNMRLYVKGAEQKDAGNDWRRRLFEMMIGDAKLQEFISFMRTHEGLSNNKLAEMFQKFGMGGTTLFYQLLKSLKSIEVEEDAKPIKLGIS